MRASEAHTWVEVYFPNYGWSTFDPTPPDPNPTSLLRTSRLGLYLDALGEFWREWVINYDFGHQSNLTFKVAMLSRSRLFSWKLAILRRYYKLVAHAGATDLRQLLRRYGLLLMLLVALLVLAANAGKLVHLWRDYRIAARPEDAPRAAASIWYERMTASLARPPSSSIFCLISPRVKWVSVPVTTMVLPARGWGPARTGAASSVLRPRSRSSAKVLRPARLALIETRASARR